MTKYPKTNDYRLLQNLKKITGIPYDDMSLSEYMSVVRATDMWLPECMIIYDTFPVLGEFLAPSAKSALWGLIMSTDQTMLVTDAILLGAPSLFMCIKTSPTDCASDVADIVRRQVNPSVFVNTFENETSILFRLNSLRE